MATAPLQRAREILADPRDPKWLELPGQGTQVLRLLCDVVQYGEELGRTIAEVRAWHGEAIGGVCGSCRVPFPCDTRRATDASAA